MKRKLLALLLALVMLVTMLPLQTFAAEEGTVLAQVTGVTVGEEAPWTYSFTLDTTGILNVTIGECSPGWRYKIYYPDETETTWCSASVYSVGPDADFEITQTGTYTIALYAYNSTAWSNVDGTVSATLSFTSSEIEVEKEEWIISDTTLALGENTLTMDPGAVTTIFEFSPDETGIYSFTANDSTALVGYWGRGSYLIEDTTANKTNSVEATISAVGQSAMIGISGVETATLTVEKISDYELATIEYTVYKNTEFDDWADYVIDNTTFKAISVTDSTADVIVKCEDGLYRYGSETGRVVVANLSNNAYMSFSAILGNGAIRVAFEDENGNYTTGLDMTDAITEYNDAGRYPLTDELIYMLKLIGKDRGWYDINTTGGFYLFGSKAVDTETAYLAFCGTVCEHTWVDADCENAKTCSACGKTDGDALGHTEVTVPGSAATCTESGLTDGVSCSVCGEVITAREEIPAIGHKPTDVNRGDGTHYSICCVCLEPLGDPVEHTFVDGVCSCNAVQTMKIYFQNNWLWTEVSIYYWFADGTYDYEWPGVTMDYYVYDGTYDIYVWEVPVTVAGLIISGIKDDGSGDRDTTPDITAGWYDGICYYMTWDNGNQVGSFNISDIELECQHQEETLPGYDATCTEPGLTDGVICTVCGETITAQEVIPATGHSYGEDGVCTGCGETEAIDSVKFQTKTEDGESAIRLVSYVGDLTAFSSVKFTVTIDGNTTELVCTNAYRSVLAGGKQVTASDVFGEDAAYFVMYTLENITEADYAKDMTITVTWTSVDGTETVSQSRTVNVGDLVG